MSAAIIGALIGAAAVVLGVYLAQNLIIRNQEKVNRLNLSESLMATMQIMFDKMASSTDPAEWTPDVNQINRLLIQIEAACSHLGRWRRRELEALLDECHLVVVNAPGRAHAAGGILPDGERMHLMYRVTIVSMSIRDARDVTDVQEFGKALDFYALNGLDAQRPGNPGYRVPPRNLRNRFHQFIKRQFREPQPPTGEGGFTKVE